MAIILSVCFLPLLTKSLDSGVTLFSLVLPLVCFTISTLYGINNSFSVLYVFLATVLIALVIFLRVPLVWDFFVFYGLSVLIGNIVGMIFYKRNVRVKPLEKHRRIISIVTAVSIAGGYIIAFAISAVMMSQMTQITYKLIAYGEAVREDVVDFGVNTVQRNHKYSLDKNATSEISTAEIFKIKSICSLSLFPLWQKHYYNPFIMDGDQYTIIRAYRDSESVVSGYNAYPLAYRLVMMVIENVII